MPSFSKDPLSYRFYHPDLVLVGISMLPFETCKRCKDFTPLLLHKDPKSQTPVWDVACVPQPVWPAQSVLLVMLHRLPPQSHSWPIPEAPAVLPKTWSAGRFDILNSCYIQTPFTELVFAEEWIILFDNTVFTSGKMWHSRHQISVSVFCLAIKVPDYNPWEFNTPLQQFPLMLLEWAHHTLCWTTAAWISLITLE